MWGRVTFESDNETILRPLSFFKDSKIVCEELRGGSVRDNYMVFWSDDPNETPESLLKKEKRILCMDNVNVRIRGKKTKQPMPGYYKASLQQWDETLEELESSLDSLVGRRPRRPTGRPATQSEATKNGELKKRDVKKLKELATRAQNSKKIPVTGKPEVTKDSKIDSTTEDDLNDSSDPSDLDNDLKKENADLKRKLKKYQGLESDLKELENLKAEVKKLRHCNGQLVDLNICHQLKIQDLEKDVGSLKRRHSKSASRSHRPSEIKLKKPCADVGPSRPTNSSSKQKDDAVESMKDHGTVDASLHNAMEGSEYCESAENSPFTIPQFPNSILDEGPLVQQVADNLTNEATRAASLMGVAPTGAEGGTAVTVLQPAAVVSGAATSACTAPPMKKVSTPMQKPSTSKKGKVLGGINITEEVFNKAMETILPNADIPDEKKIDFDRFLKHSGCVVAGKGGDSQFFKDVVSWLWTPQELAQRSATGAAHPNDQSRDRKMPCSPNKKLYCKELLTLRIKSELGGVPSDLHERIADPALNIYLKEKIKTIVRSTKTNN